MSSTITYGGTHTAREFSFKGIGILVAGLVLGAAIGVAIASYSTTTDIPEVSVTGMPLDDFIRLNTTSYNGLAPAATAVVVESVAVDPGFLEINVGSFNGLAPAASAAVNPGFLEMNVGSFDGLTQVVSPQTVEPSFLEMNIGSLEFPAGGYSEPSNGLR